MPLEVIRTAPIISTPGLFFKTGSGVVYVVPSPELPGVEGIAGSDPHEAGIRGAYAPVQQRQVQNALEVLRQLGFNRAELLSPNSSMGYGNPTIYTEDAINKSTPYYPEMLTGEAQRSSRPYKQVFAPYINPLERLVGFQPSKIVINTSSSFGDWYDIQLKDAQGRVIFVDANFGKAVDTFIKDRGQGQIEVLRASPWTNQLPYEYLDPDGQETRAYLRQLPPRSIIIFIVPDIEPIRPTPAFSEREIRNMMQSDWDWLKMLARSLGITVAALMFLLGMTEDARAPENPNLADELKRRGMEHEGFFAIPESKAGWFNFGVCPTTDGGGSAVYWGIPSFGTNTFVPCDEVGSFAVLQGLFPTTVDPADHSVNHWADRTGVATYHTTWHKDGDIEFLDAPPRVFPIPQPARKPVVDPFLIPPLTPYEPDALPWKFVNARDKMSIGWRDQMTQVGPVYEPSVRPPDLSFSPGLPPRVVPPIPWYPPPAGSGEAESKNQVRKPMHAVLKEFISKVTESCDAIEAIWDSLPKAYQRFVPGTQLPGGKKQYVPTKLRPPCDKMAQDVYTAAIAGKIDINRAAYNLAIEQLTDYFYGAQGQAAKKAARNLNTTLTVQRTRIAGAILPPRI